MAKRGRRTKYTPETVKAITDAIAEGNTQEDAAILAGVNAATFYLWMTTKIEFSESVKNAHARFKKARINAIKSAGRRLQEGQIVGSWQADAWLMERKYPDEFGQRLSLKVAPEDYDLLRKMGFKTPTEAWQALLDNARQEYANANSDS